jgi:hypothetical protein
MAHEASHEERILEHLDRGEPNLEALLAEMVDCRECLTFACRILEDLTRIASPRAQAADALVNALLDRIATENNGGPPVTARRPQEAS